MVSSLNHNQLVHWLCIDQVDYKIGQNLNFLLKHILTQFDSFNISAPRFKTNIKSFSIIYVQCIRDLPVKCVEALLAQYFNNSQHK